MEAQLTYRQFMTAVDQYSEVHDVSESTAALRVMTLCVMSMAGHIPNHLRPALRAAVDRWYVGELETASWESHRDTCWRYLDEKNGDSVTIADKTDVAVRGLICLLHDELAIDDQDMTLDFFGNLLGSSDVDAVAVAGLNG